MGQVRFTAAARLDLADAVDWYKAHAPEVLSPFRAALRMTVTRIGTSPAQFPLILPDTRQALLRRFPYLIIFRERDGIVYVVAFFHTNRNPRIWQSRVD